jgi:hypothetical protein
MLRQSAETSHHNHNPISIRSPLKSRNKSELSVICGGHPALISPLDHNVLLGRLIGGLGDAGFVEEHGGAHLFVAGQLFVAVGA